MTITSIGYEGTVSELQWGSMVPRVGGVFYAVNDYSSFRVTVAAGTRTVQVAPGGASCTGIYDTSNAIETVSLASVPSGSRWDLVVLRRSWAANATTVAVVQGGSQKVIPTRNVATGSIHDQPLALVRVLAGSTAIQEIVDLRVVGLNSASQIAFDELTRSYVTHHGANIRIANNLYRRTLNNLGQPLWEREDVTPDTGWIDLTRNSGWTFTNAHARRIGPLVYYRIMASRNLPWGVDNGLIDVVPLAMRPAANWYVGSSNGTGRSEFRFTPDGRVLATVPSNGATGLTLYGSYPVS